MLKNLTKTQNKIAYALAEGKSVKKIADETGTSYNTISRHVVNIYERLGFPIRDTNVNCRALLVRYILLGKLEVI